MVFGGSSTWIRQDSRSWKIRIFGQRSRQTAFIIAPSMTTPAILAEFAAEPLGWNNIQRFLQEGPSRARGQRGCFAVNSMRELECLPREARNYINAGRQRVREHLMRNVRAESPKMDAAAVCDLVSVFFSGISIEANLNPDPSAVREKVANFMGMLRRL
jgi:hypothetical protein